MTATPSPASHRNPRGRLRTNAVNEAEALNKPELSENDMEAKRQDLFANGSEFLKTAKSDIVGIDNVLNEIDDVIHWLVHAPIYQEHKSRLEPGIVFEGDPGTGKTLVSRYIASESNALFVNVRDWPHNGAFLSDQDVSKLFALARATYAVNGQPIVLFWDEFEGNAMERANATPEQASAVAQLTAELDGVHGKNEGVLLIGCTNYIHAIDHALLRSGRMGLHIEFHAPDREGKGQLLDHYLGKITTEGVIDIETLSYFFDTGATAADIEEACVEAWRYAVRRSIEEGRSVALSQVDLMKVFVKRLVGPPTAFVNLSHKERRIVALHETGHALTALIYDVPVRLITVQPGQRTLGRVITAEINDYVGTQKDFLNHMRVSGGSIAAEGVAGLDATIGSVGDISQVMEYAHRLTDVLNFNGSTFNPVALSESRNGAMMEQMAPSVADDTIREYDEKVKSLVKEVEHELARTMNKVGDNALWALADCVNDRVTLTGQEFTEVAARILGTNDFASFRRNLSLPV
jgi:cell division protease FtsH